MPDFLKSRGFWTSITATVTAVSVCLVRDGECGAAIVAAISAWLAYFGVAASRAARGMPRNYAQADREGAAIRSIRKHG